MKWLLALLLSGCGDCAEAMKQRRLEKLVEEGRRARAWAEQLGLEVLGVNCFEYADPAACSVRVPDHVYKLYCTPEGCKQECP